jgi:hypothetical protein
VAEIPVRNVVGYLPVIREAEAARWPLVADGTCRVESALRIFNLFFESTGLHISDRLRLTPLSSDDK